MKRLGRWASALLLLLALATSAAAGVEELIFGFPRPKPQTHQPSLGLEQGGALLLENGSRLLLE